MTRDDALAPLLASAEPLKIFIWGKPLYQIDTATLKSMLECAYTSVEIAGSEQTHERTMKILDERTATTG